MGISNPTVSVVIPTQSRPDLLIRAVESVFRQSYQDFEIIVVLDGADQATREILRRNRRAGQNYFYTRSCRRV